MLRQSWPQPWFDEQGGVYPVYHVVRGLAGLAGKPLRELEISAPGKVQAVAVDTDSGLLVWVANLTAEKIEIRLPQPARVGFVLDSANFVSAASNTRAVDTGRMQVDGSDLTLGAYAVANILF